MKESSGSRKSNIEKYTLMRQEFHRIPEIAFNEFKTKALIMKHLNELEGREWCSVREVGMTGVIVDIGVEKGRWNIAFRADIDGLRLDEESGVEYRSEHDGMMHACGHDSHITIIIGVIEVCLKNIEMIKKESFGYGFRFIFQPGEEVGKGALEMIEKGCLDGISEIYGIHNVPGILIDEIGTIEGAMMGRTDKFLIKVFSQAKDKDDSVIKCACNISHMLNQVDTKGKAAFAICAMNYNNLNDNDNNKDDVIQAEIKGTIRTYDNSIGDQFLNDIQSICESISKVYNCQSAIEFNSTKALINSKQCFNFIKKIIDDSNGKYSLNTNGLPAMASDDFAYYLQQIPGNYFGFGISTSLEETKSNYVHNSHYIYNDNATLPAISFLIHLINSKCQALFI